MVLENCPAEDECVSKVVKGGLAMEPVVQELRQRLDSLVDEWLRSAGPDRMRLVQEKIRLEELIEAAQRGTVIGDEAR